MVDQFLAEKIKKHGFIATLNALGQYKIDFQSCKASLNKSWFVGSIPDEAEKSFIIYMFSPNSINYFVFVEKYLKFLEFQKKFRF